jgi:hypothetical protein
MMNDFTQEELIAIRDNLSAGYTRQENNILYGVYQKLESMIYNYCEHEDINQVCYHHMVCNNCKKVMVVSND